jgi:hypothetical protein
MYRIMDKCFHRPSPHYLYYSTIPLIKPLKHKTATCILLLIADTPDYDPIVIAGDSNARILGKAVSFMGKF